jgi:hypothetical protein
MLNTNLTAVKAQENNFTTEAGQIIGYEKGAKMVKRHFDENNEELNSHFIGRDMIEAILKQPGTVGISILPGLNKDGASEPVLVGVDAQGNYILDVTTVDMSGEMKKQKGIVAVGVISPGTGTQTNDGCGWY